MPRPRKETTDRMDSVLRVRCSREDRLLILSKARQASLKPSEYIRRMAFNGKVVPRDPGLLALAKELNSIGNNLNQQTAIAHMQGELPEALREIWADLHALMDKIMGRLPG